MRAAAKTVHSQKFSMRPPKDHDNMSALDKMKVGSHSSLLPFLSNSLHQHGGGAADIHDIPPPLPRTKAPGLY